MPGDGERGIVVVFEIGFGGGGDGDLVGGGGLKAFRAAGGGLAGGGGGAGEARSVGREGGGGGGGGGLVGNARGAAAVGDDQRVFFLGEDFGELFLVGFEVDGAGDVGFLPGVGAVGVDYGDLLVGNGGFEVVDADVGVFVGGFLSQEARGE